MKRAKIGAIYLMYALYVAIIICKALWYKENDVWIFYVVKILCVNLKVFYVHLYYLRTAAIYVIYVDEFYLLLLLYIIRDVKVKYLVLLLNYFIFK